MRFIKAFYLRMQTLIYMLLLLSVAHVASADESQLQALKQQYLRPAEIFYPADNPYSQAKHELGKILFFDTRFSSNGKISCASCHQPDLAWGDGLPLGVGVNGKQLRRKTPSLLNLAWDHQTGYLWDGRASSLETQAIGPFVNSDEMHRSTGKLLDVIEMLAGYQTLFAAAFPDEKRPVTLENFGKAMATFQRGIISGTAPFDRWIEGDETAISADAKQGFVLFNGKARCANCHAGWRFSDGSYHDIGIADKDIGRGAEIPDATLLHAFKTVGLRDIALRAPYMHNGSIKDLSQVIEHYNDGFTRRDSLSALMQPLDLSAQEKQQLLRFLQTLTSEQVLKITAPIMPAGK